MRAAERGTKREAGERFGEDDERGTSCVSFLSTLTPLANVAVVLYTTEVVLPTPVVVKVHEHTTLSKAEPVIWLSGSPESRGRLEAGTYERNVCDEQTDTRQLINKCVNHITIVRPSKLRTVLSPVGPYPNASLSRSLQQNALDEFLFFRCPKQ